MNVNRWLFFLEKVLIALHDVYEHYPISSQYVYLDFHVKHIVKVPKIDCITRRSLHAMQSAVLRVNSTK